MRYRKFIAAVLLAASASAAQAAIITYDLTIDLSKAIQSGSRLMVNLPADLIKLSPNDTLQGTVTFTGGDIVTIANLKTAPGQYELVQLSFLPSPSTGYVDAAVSSVSFLGVSGNYKGDATVQSMATDLTASAFADLTKTSFSFTGFTYKLDYLSGSATTFKPSQLALGYNVTVTAPAPVPEPASWALMIGGFGMVGAALRRRRSPEHGAELIHRSW